jgi:UDP-N-acetylglucosamine:LPS N-acetylglucosamine transferase
MQILNLSNKLSRGHLKILKQIVQFLLDIRWNILFFFCLNYFQMVQIINRFKMWVCIKNGNFFAILRYRLSVELFIFMIFYYQKIAEGGKKSKLIAVWNLLWFLLYLWGLTISRRWPNFLVYLKVLFCQVLC